MAKNNAILRMLIEGVLTDIYPKTGADNVVFMDGEVEKTVAEKLAEILAAVANLPTTNAVNTAISTAISGLINGAPETYNTLKEVADYIATHEEVVTALNAAIGNKLDKSTFTEFQATLGTLATKNVVSEAELDTALKEKINGASTNSHTHANKNVLDGIDEEDVENWDEAYNHSQSDHAPADAQANVIETVQVNGEALTPDDNKAVNIAVPVTYVQKETPANMKNGDWFVQILD